MAQISGTLDTYQTKGKAEDFRDVIYTIAVQNKPFLSLAGKTDSVKATKHLWQTDALRTPADNAQIEGDEAAFAVPAATAEVGNFLQISRETVIVTGTNQAVKMYGRKDELKRQLRKKSDELLRDVERAIVGVNQASVAGASATARRSGSMTGWLTTNTSRGAGGANGGYSSGSGLVVAATDGTQRAFTETLYKSVVQSCHQQGSMPSIAMMSPKDKVTFSSFAGIAVNRVDNSAERSEHKQAIILAGADVYQGDFGKQAIVSNPFMSTALGGRAREAFLLDPGMVDVGYLRRMTTETLGRSGDAEKRLLLCEWTLVVKNEAAHGVIADLT
jgi:hypothetical protein